MRIGFQSKMTEFQFQSPLTDLHLTPHSPMKTPAQQTQLLQSEVLEELEAQTRLLLVREMKLLKVTYGELSARLAALGLHETPDRLNRKVNRQKFSATFLFACLKALDVPILDLQTLDITQQGREARLQDERIAETFLKARRRNRK